MTTFNEYLREILKSQSLDENGTELNELRARRADVEACLKTHLEGSPEIKEGGSKAKGTMIRASYDLDLFCYFANEEDDDGDTLQALYDAVADALNKEFSIQKKRSAIRVKSSDGVDFHVDVVPGRYVSAAKSDVFLHQNEGTKERLKTNPAVHISHVKNSGCVDEIRLAKIWREHQSLNTKTFVLELAVIDALSETTGDLATRMRTLLEAFRDRINELVVSDPANANNDLSPMWTKTIRDELADAARDALKAIDRGDWSSVFGVASTDAASESRKSVVRRAAAAVVVPTRPYWRSGR
jgi:hypothetical protein